MEAGKEALEIAKKHVVALAMELIDQVLVQALEEAAKKSETPIDDVLVAALKEPLKQSAKDLLAKI